MTKQSLLVFVSALLVGKVSTDSHGACVGAPDCPLFSGQSDGMVSLQQLTQKIQGKHWIMIYYSEFSTTQNYGKCNFRWNAPDLDGNVHRELMCYNKAMKGCEDFAQKVKRMADNCNRASENNVTNELMEAKFYSQNLDQYFWYDSCYEYNNADECTTRYLDLLVSKTRYPDSGKSELDLFELPWAHIVSDLKNHLNMSMSDPRMKFSWTGEDLNNHLNMSMSGPRMKFSWTGEECGFDGKLIETSGAGRRDLGIIALSIVFVVTRLF